MGIIKSLALQVPQIRDIWEQRNKAMAERDALRGEVANLDRDARIGRPLSEVINVNRYKDPEWLDIHRRVAEYSTDKHVFFDHAGHIVRKGWEWTQCIYGLERLDMIKEGHSALGVGSGREPISFYLADRIGKVVATDLYGNETWTNSNGAEAPADIVEDATKYCPRPYRADRLSFQNADGTNLPYADESFDFCWTISSIEHFGGHGAAAQSMREMARVTKPGGIVSVVTEYVLLPEISHPEYFNRSQIEEHLIGATDDLQLVDGMNWDVPPTEYLVDQIALGTEGVHRTRRHVVLNDGFCQFTSFILFLRKR